MSSYQLAQLNIALMRAPIDSPVLADFVANLDRINQLAEQSTGFVWRLQTDEGNATSIGGFGEDYIVNMSVWENIETLHDFVFKSGHVDIMRRRKEWFDRVREAYAVLWWIPTSHHPTVEEAREKLEHLKKFGPTLDAFTFRNPFPSPDQSQTESKGYDDACPAI